jgi:hypothetical protein
LGHEGVGHSRAMWSAMYCDAAVGSSLMISLMVSIAGESRLKGLQRVSNHVASLEANFSEVS